MQNNAVYEGSLGIWKNHTLIPVEQVIEHHFADYLQANLTHVRKKYREDNGNVLDTDRARGLSSVWNLSHFSRSVCCSAVHNPASAFVHDLYRNTLRQKGSNLVVFTAGGGGSGKSVAVEQFAKQMTADALLIYDSTFSSRHDAVEKVEAALRRGKSVFIIYVYRPFPAAVQGVIQRAVLSGRTVPLNILARDHIESPRTVLSIADTYVANDNVQVIALDNSGEDVSEVRVFNAHEEVIHFLENVAYNRDSDALLRQAKRILENEASQGYIPEYILTALERNYQR